MEKRSVMAATAIFTAAFLLPAVLNAQDQPQPGMSCPVDHDKLADILKKSVKPGGGPSNGGLDNNEWAAVVNRQGVGSAQSPTAAARPMISGLAAVRSQPKRPILPMRSA
ncbi:hypothetical protein ACVWW5_003565 [Bradyrhizobium sp. LM3.4]